MRLWINVCGGPAVLAVLGYALLRLVEHLQLGTYLGAFRVEVLYASLIAFGLGIAWAVRSLWIVLRAYWGKGETCVQCGFPTAQKQGQEAHDFKCWGCGSNQPERS